jgi:hypothetical protein
MNSSLQNRRDNRRASPGELGFIVMIVSAVLILPLVFGELFPFTSAPMFRDSPQVYCDYEITGPEGVRLKAKDFHLQRNYDGNPPGLGAGVQPAATLDRFGFAPEIATVRAHVEKLLRARPQGPAFIDVRQRVIGATDDDRIGVIRDTSIRVVRDVR